MQSRRISPALKWIVAILIGGPILLLAIIAVMVASFFWVGPEVRAMRNAVIENSSTDWDRLVELSFGRGTFGMANLASAFINDMPPEARAAIQSARKGEVSVYQFRGSQPRGVLEKADSKMTERGWYRAVGVVTGNETVAVYLPNRVETPNDLAACVLVLNQEHLICVSAESDLEPLMRLAHQHLKNASLSLARRD